MLTITAIIRTKKGHEETVRQALLDHAANVERDEPIQSVSISHKTQMILASLRLMSGSQIKKRWTTTTNQNLLLSFLLSLDRSLMGM